MTEQEQSIEQLKFDSSAVIVRVAEVIAGHTLESGLDDAAEYLPKTPGSGVRSETSSPLLDNLTEEQIVEIRAEVAKIGIGAEQSTGLKEAGMPEGTTVIAEGGLPNKMLAQLKMITENDRKPGVIIMSASMERQAGKADKARMGQITKVLGVNPPEVDGKTEFELAQITAGLYPSFTAEDPTPLPYGYDLHDGGITPKSEESGQTLRIGSIDSVPVVVLGVEKFHRDDSGRNFYQPSVADLRSVAQQIAVNLNPDIADKPVATVTSNLYGPSRRLQNPDTLTYGTKVMEEVVGEEAALATIPNIVSELHRTHTVLKAT